MAENKIVNGYECSLLNQGRHEAELQALKEGQLKMEKSIQDLTNTLKEYIELAQETQNARIKSLEDRHDKAEKAISILTTNITSTTGRANFAYRVIITTSGALIVGLVGTVFGLLWSNAVKAHASLEVANHIISCLS